MRSIYVLGAVMVGSMALAVAPVSCGNTPNGGFPTDNDSGLGGEGGDDGSDPFGHDGATGDVQDSLIVTPANITLNAPGTPVTQAYVATLASTSNPVTASWGLGNPAMGTIDATGLFTSNGTVGGVTDIDANYGSVAGQTTVTVNVALTENPGSVSGAVQTQLKAGGNADSQFKWLYPYDATVFPRGLTSPTLQAAGTPSDASWVHITSAHLTYDGFYGATNTGTCPQGSCIDFSAATWKNITESAGASDPVKVQITKITGGKVTGPITETWNIAQANLHGTVYYDTYTSQLASGGATLYIKVGKPAAVLLASCTTCHSVSANGNVLAASYGHTYDATWDLTKSTVPPPIVGPQQTDHTYSFPAIYPDGSLLLTTYGDKIPGVWVSNAPQLFDVKKGTGTAVPSALGMASMPAFSDDGKMLVFNDEAASASGHTLRTTTFDIKTKTFGKVSDLVTDMTNYPSWPQFTPDALRVMYGQNDNPDYSTWSGHHANLAQVDVGTKKVTTLDSLNGMKGSSTYLPYGTSETNLNYEPTVLPLAVGGYYWVVFTSRRYYGNLINPNNYPSQDDTPRKKLWVAAIDISPKPGVDPSHPAFYLPGQEFPAGNMRGFWALDPCKTNGNTCETADECCGGYCRQVMLSDGGFGHQCVPPPGGCSNEFEVCTTASDCCNSSNLCINGHCSSPPVN